MSLQTWEESEERQDDFLRALAEERECWAPGLYLPARKILIVPSSPTPGSLES